MNVAIEESGGSQGQFYDSLKTHKRTVPQILKPLTPFVFFSPIYLADKNIMCIFAACSSEYKHFICSFATRIATSNVNEQYLTKMKLALSVGFPYSLEGCREPEWRMVIACAFLVYKLVQHLDEVITFKQ